VAPLATRTSASCARRAASSDCAVAPTWRDFGGVEGGILAVRLRVARRRARRTVARARPAAGLAARPSRRHDFSKLGARTQLSAHAWPARAAPQAAVRAVRARTLCPTGPPPRASPRASLPTPSRASPRFCRTAGARVSSSTNRNREKKNFLKAPCCWWCRRGQGADSGAMPSDHYGVRGRSRAPPRVPVGCAGAGRPVGSAGRALG